MHLQFHIVKIYFQGKFLFLEQVHLYLIGTAKFLSMETVMSISPELCQLNILSIFEFFLVGLGLEHRTSS
jgi:hypothetical protein